MKLKRKPVATSPPILILDPSTRKPPIVGRYPDRFDGPTMYEGIIKRFGVKMPDEDPDEMSLFLSFSLALVKLFTPVARSELLTHEEWLKNAPYGLARKLKLERDRSEITNVNPDLFASKMFGKFEFYREYKHLRLINSPSDFEKTVVGPYIKAVDKATFKHPAFVVKNRDPKELPTELERRFGKKPVLETDYSSMEAHHTGPRAKIIREWLRHMLRDVRNPVIEKILDGMVHGTNVCENKLMTAKIDERLMSGVMYTSSANGVLNLCLMSYLIYRATCPELDAVTAARNIFNDFPGVVEGDDGMTLDLGQDERILLRLGAKCKMERHPSFNEASFCSINCPIGANTLVTDPLKLITKLAMLPSQYDCYREGKRIALLRATAMSLYYQYRNMPVIGELCHHILKRTRSVDTACVNQTFDWKAQQVHECIERDRKTGKRLWDEQPEVMDIVRVHVEKKYGFSIRDQLAAENAICNSTDVIWLPVLDVLEPSDVNHMHVYCAKQGAEFIEPEEINPRSCPDIKGKHKLKNVIRRITRTGLQVDWNY